MEKKQILPNIIMSGEDCLTSIGCARSTIDLALLAIEKISGEERSLLRQELPKLSPVGNLLRVSGLISNGDNRAQQRFGIGN